MAGVDVSKIKLIITRLKNNMVIRCNVCGKPVTQDLPDNTVIRAGVICPECLESYNNGLKIIINIGKNAFPEKFISEK